ncbi:hypothetical protein LSH36_162g08051 [Paralvinella palmiformis]|uniref:SSD domain-containing protein n=1 Tax=Paralvinella palmiformis TaxID=53620 RepID=A0AAD9N6H5_9ANNE|nr:hypothetical protein LSH36_162g08051 [Paralvinella palmiformis]
MSNKQLQVKTVSRDVEMTKVDTDLDPMKGGHVNPVNVLLDENGSIEPPKVVMANGEGTEYPNKSPEVSEKETASEEDAEVLKKREAKRNREPLLYCKIICNWTKLSFGLTLAGHIFFVLITVILMKTGYDILPITFDRLPLDIKDNVDYLRDMAWTHRDDEDNKDLVKRQSYSGGSSTESERTTITDVVEICFEIPGGNVFTKENLKALEEAENNFFNNERFQKSFCLLDDGGACKKPRSIIRYFDGTFSAMDPAFYDPEFDNIALVLAKANSNRLINEKLQYHLGKDATITADEARSSITRSAIMVGSPLSGYATSADREDEQLDVIKEFMLDVFKPLGDRYFKDGVGAMDFFYNSVTIISVTITGQVKKDMALAIGSLNFIVLFMIGHIRSLWIALFAAMSIVTSFFGANLFYRTILDYRYFGIFHVLALFIILGIGADDVFVFVDTWKDTAHHRYASLAHRMSDCYRKASLAMMFTSLTTAQAFIVSATSPFLGIGTFGVFAGILVFVNYVSVIVFLPTVVVMYHKYFEKYKCCCCGSSGAGGGGNQDTVVVPVGGSGSDGLAEERRKNRLVRFFRGRYYDFVTHRIAKWVILALFGVMTTVFVYFATTVKVNEEEVKFLKDDTNIGKYLTKRNTAFSTVASSETLEIVIAWGLREQDLSECHHTDAKCTGKTVWDDTFNVNSPEAQEALLEFCRTLKTLPDETIEKLHIRRNINNGKPEVDCFIDVMYDFMQNEGSRVVNNKARYPNDTDLSLPITKNKVDIITKNNNNIYTVPLDGDFDHYFEIAMSFWLYNGFLPNDVSGIQLYDYGYLLGEAEYKPYTVSTNVGVEPMNFTYKYGTKLRYAGVTTTTTLMTSSMGYPKGLPIRDAWEEFVSGEVAKMPTPLKGGFQIGPRAWHWFKVQETLTSSAVLGIVIGLCVALPLLILATSNIILGLMATLSIICVTVGVLAVIPMAGWKLGVLESLNLVLVVGLSVDYVVHLAEGYSRSVHEHRLGRTRDMLEEVGISVVSGALTTIGASVFLLFAEILFFAQFGIFMFCTIFFSISYALVFFVTLVAIIGPQKEFGSLKPIYRWFGSKCCRKRSN